MARTGRELHVMTGSFVAGADLSDKQFYAVKMGANDGEVVLAGDGEGLGLLLNKPASGQDTSVMLLGMTKGISNGALARGVEVTASAAGKLKAAGAKDVVLGITNTAATAADQIVELIMTGRFHRKA